MVRFSLEDLILQADAIVLGTVTGQRTEQTAKGLQTRVTLAVEKSLKGDVGKKVTITHPGGAVGGVEMRNPDAATFAEGTDVVVFLRIRADEHTVLGNFQGKLSIETDKELGKIVTLPREKSEPSERVKLPDLIHRIEQVLVEKVKENGENSDEP